MKGKLGFIAVVMLVLLSFFSLKTRAQCSICTRSVQQMGERPGKAFNAGILYLAFTPLAIGGILSMPPMASGVKARYKIPALNALPGRSPICCTDRVHMEH